MPSPNVRILCVEDDPDTGELTILTLAEKGFDVICTDNADIVNPSFIAPETFW